MVRGVYVGVVLVTWLAYCEACCQPDQYSVQFDMSGQVGGYLQGNISGQSYADYTENKFYWGGSGHLKFQGLSNPMSMEIDVGIDVEEEVIWYSMSSPLLKRCEAYQFVGAIPDDIKCLFDDFTRVESDTTDSDEITLVSPTSTNFYEEVAVDETCIPIQAKVAVESPVAFVLTMKYGEANIGKSAVEGMEMHKMPLDCELAGKFEIPAEVRGSRTKRSAPFDSAAYRRLLRSDAHLRRQRRGIFDFAEKYANRAMEKIRDTVNNPSKVVDKVKDIYAKGKDAAGKLKDKVQDALENPDQVVDKIKGLAAKGKDAAAKLKDKIHDVVENRDEILKGAIARGRDVVDTVKGAVDEWE